MYQDKYLKMRKYAKEMVILLLCIDCGVTACPFDCATCYRPSYCSRCRSSYILTYYGFCSSCPSTCRACNGYDYCASCMSGYWGKICQSHCHGNCLHCQQYSGNCYQCRNGLYGQNCDKNCYLCKNELCDLYKCVNGCKAGYYEYTYGYTTSCKRCSANCKFCKSETECTVCDDGFYLSKFNSYTRSSAYCYQCLPHKPSCQNNCFIQNCKTCQVQSNTYFCKECNLGYIYNGIECIRCSEGCSGECDESGLCIGLCNDGYSGNRCSESCASQCVKCSKANSKVCRQCKGDYFTSSCNVTCPSSCKTIKGRQTCSLNEGYCLNGCTDKLWGQQCYLPCSSGCIDDSVITQVCNMKNGKCTHGCKDGFTGDKCEINLATTTPGIHISSNKTEVRLFTSTITPTVKAQATSALSKTKISSAESTTTSSRMSIGTTGALQEGQNKTIIIGSAAGGGVVLLILISVFIFCLAKKGRKSYSERRANNSMKRNENQIKVTKNGELLKPESVPETQEYIYAKPIKSRNKQNKGDNEDTHNNVSIDIDVDHDRVEETDVDAIVLEDLEDGTNSFIETEVDIPTTDIYYNTVGLIRSRIQVTNLLDYIKTKTDFKKEFEKLPKGLTRPCNEALRPNNRLKSRYNGIYAYDATRVVLQSKDFINANYIDGHKLSPAYIASLGPTQSTMNNFATCWEMMWQEKIDKIIMLTNLKEGKGSQIRRVTHYHYTAWPDKTVPDNVVSLLEFRDKVEQTQTKGSGLVMVHCSAGIGRTGTYIALDILIKEGREEYLVDIFGCVNTLRGQRVQMVQNVEQYVYLHHCVLYALTCDAEPLPVTAVPHYMTDERILAQHEAFVNMQLLVNGEKTKIKSRNENRKGADFPGENHRLRLTLAKHDYINAVYLNGYQKVNKFIVAQTPLPNTLEDFVSMLYQERCPCVVCLDEENVKDKSVAQYLPPANKVSKFDHFQVACMNSDQRQDFVIRELKISRIGSPLSEELSVFHYQFKSWGSTDCVPPRTLTFLKMVMDVDKTMQRLNCEQPIVVHCTTGAERSGLYCAVSILLEKVAVEKEVSVLNTICQVCSRRNSAFRDIEHLRFCYNCVEEMLEMSDTNTYYNIGNV